MIDPITTIGKILGADAKRDAIHIAIAPVIAAHALRPGDRVGINDSGYADSCTDQDVGIVDPFLKEPVRRGQTIWLFLFPNTVTGMRHHWQHPKFPEVDGTYVVGKEAHVQTSRRWLDDHASELGLSMDVLLSDARAYLETGNIKVQHDSSRWRDTFKTTEFWHHYEIVTGVNVLAEQRSNIYCCTC